MSLNPNSAAKKWSLKKENLQIAKKIQSVMGMPPQNCHEIIRTNKFSAEPSEPSSNHFDLQQSISHQLMALSHSTNPFLDSIFLLILWTKLPFLFHLNWARCLKITEKVSFNIASEASYVYILSGQKLIKNAKIGPFWRVFENMKLAVKHCYQTGQF